MIRKALRWLGRRLLDLGESPAPKTLTNRNQLLREDARGPGDSCEAFVELVPGDEVLFATCETDGHYLCAECANMEPRVRYERKHGEYPPDDWTPADGFDRVEE